MKSRFVSLAGALALLATSSVVAQEDGKITGGRLDAIGADGKALGACPPKHTEVEAEISGTLARVSVTQQFHNPFKDKIEAIYVFPLHQESAVDDMTMTVGARVVKGLIKEFVTMGSSLARSWRKVECARQSRANSGGLCSGLRAFRNGAIPAKPGGPDCKAFLEATGGGTVGTQAFTEV